MWLWRWTAENGLPGDMEGKTSFRTFVNNFTPQNAFSKKKKVLMGSVCSDLLVKTNISENRLGFFSFW